VDEAQSQEDFEEKLEYYYGYHGPMEVRVMAKVRSLHVKI